MGDITDSEADFFWLCGEGNNDGSKQTSASSYGVTSHVLNREYFYDDDSHISKYVLFVIYAINLCLCQLRGCHLVNDGERVLVLFFLFISFFSQ